MALQPTAGTLAICTAQAPEAERPQLASEAQRQAESDEEADEPDGCASSAGAPAVEAVAGGRLENAPAEVQPRRQVGPGTGCACVALCARLYVFFFVCDARVHACACVCVWFVCVSHRRLAFRVLI